MIMGVTALPRNLRNTTNRASFVDSWIIDFPDVWMSWDCMDDGDQVFPGSFPTQRPQSFPDFAIDARRFVRRRLDELRPTPAIRFQLALTQQIRSLHNRLERVAQVVRQGPQMLDVTVGCSSLFLSATLDRH